MALIPCEITKTEKKKIFVHLKIHSWILLFSRIWLVLTNSEKIEVLFWCVQQGKDKPLVLLNKWIQIKTPNSVRATQLPKVTQLWEAGLISKSPDFYFVACALHQLPQVNPQVSTHPRGLFLLFSLSINVLSPKHWWETQTPSTFSLPHSNIFSPPGSQFHWTQHYCYVFLGCQHETQLNSS